MRIILKKMPAIDRANSTAPIRNAQAIKIMNLLAGEFGMNVEIQDVDAVAFLRKNSASFTHNPDGWLVFKYHLPLLVTEGCIETLGGNMDKRMKTREEIEARIKMLEKEHGESIEAMIVALRWAIGAPSEETRDSRGNIWK